MKLKKLISLTLSVLVVFCSISFDADATLGLNREPIVFEKSSGKISFDSGYAIPGKPLTVLVDGKTQNQMIYHWYIDNQRIENTSNSYTPIANDLEAMITVKVFELPSGNAVGVANMLVSQLPVVYIETENRESVIVKDKVLDAHMKIQGNSEFSDEALLYDGKTEIKGRGNTTWNDDKKPYKLKLDKKSDILGMGKNKHWVLLSNPLDGSLSRNTLAYNLAGDMGIDYQKLVPVDLVLNGVHMGSYTLCEHVRIGESRIDITNWDDVAEDAAKAIYNGNKSTMTKDQRDELIDIMTDTSKDWVTTDKITFNGVSYTVSDYYTVPDTNGGYLLELDTRTPDYISKNSVSMMFNKPEVYNQEMYDNITGYYQAFEDALFSDDYTTVYNGKSVRYNELIDVDSFVKGLLVNEIVQNRDFGFKSTFLYKEVDGKLTYGPVWDADYSSDRTENYSPHNNWYTLNIKWLARLYTDPYFLNHLYNTYWEYRYTAISQLVRSDGLVYQNYDLIQSSAYKDEEIWKYDKSFDYEYERLVQWLNRRLEWLDAQFSSLNTLYSSVSWFSTNKFSVNTSTLTLSIDNGNLSITTTLNNVDYLRIYIDGAFFGQVPSQGKITQLSLSNAPKGIVSVSGYDENSNLICGNYIVNQKTAVSLMIEDIPERLEYSVGDKIDLTGLTLKAMYDDGTSAVIEPDEVITYAKDAVGAQYFDDYSTVTDTLGEKIYASLKYKNLSVDFEIEIKADEDYKKVERLIELLPNDGFDSDYLRQISDAALAFESLSSQAKEKVYNKAVLASAMDYLDLLCQGKNECVVGAFTQQAYPFAFTKNDYTIIIKGNPYKVKLIYNNSDTITFNNMVSSHVLSIRQFGEYELWTVRLTTRDYRIVTNSYQYGISEESPLNLLNVTNTKNKIGKVYYKKSVFWGESVSFEFFANKKLDEFRITENGKVLDFEDASMGNNLLLTTPYTTGEHIYSIEYKIGTSWVKLGDYSVYVREKPINLIKGDVDRNNKINSTDALMVLQHSTSLIKLGKNQVTCANVENDDVINSTDALKILLYSTGKIEKF